MKKILIDQFDQNFAKKSSLTIREQINLFTKNYFFKLTLYIFKFSKSYSFANDVTNDNFEPQILPEFYKDEESFEKRENEIAQERNRELGKIFKNEIFVKITFRNGK